MLLGAHDWSGKPRLDDYRYSLFNLFFVTRASADAFVARTAVPRDPCTVFWESHPF